MADTFPEGFIPIGDAFAKALSSIKDCNSVLKRELAGDQERIDKFFDDYDAMARDVEKLMRAALADGDLPAFIKAHNGQMEQLVDRKSWRQEAFGVPGIENVPHHLTNPGPDTDGRPIFLRSSDFESWLKIYRLKRNKRAGAPIKYDWPDAKKFAMDLLNEEGEFREWDDGGWKTPADLERRVLTYMEKATGEGNGPGASTVRAKVAQWVAEWLSQR
jgi:hypothetical protein